MRDCIVGREGQRLGQSCFCGGKPIRSIVSKERYRDCCIHVGNADKSPYVRGIERQRALIQSAGRRKVVCGEALIQPTPALKAEVH